MPMIVEQFKIDRSNEVKTKIAVWENLPGALAINVRVNESVSHDDD